MEYSRIYFLLYAGSYIHTPLLEVSSFPDYEERDDRRTVGLFGIQPPDEAASSEHFIERTPSFHTVYKSNGNRGSTVVKVLCYKSEGRWFGPSWYQWNSSLT